MATSIYYLDSSAWVKRYLKEVGTQWVENLFATQPVLACSSLGWIEVAATFARRQVAGFLTAVDAHQRFSDLDTDWAQFVQIEFTGSLTARTRDIAARRALRGADAIHLASALFLRESQASREFEITLISCDRELLVGASAEGLNVIDPINVPP